MPKNVFRFRFVFAFITLSLLLATSVILPGSAFAQGINSTLDYYGTQVAMKYLGQPSLTEVGNGAVDSNHVLHASGVIVDRSSNPNKLYVVDTGNNRILGYNGIGYCKNTNITSCTIDSQCGAGETCYVNGSNPGFCRSAATPTCTLQSDCSGGYTCVIDGTKPADIVIGQPDMNHGSCNGDSLRGMTARPTASTLCLTAYPYGTNAAEQWVRVNIDVDSQGNLFVPDIYNNRVLKYNTPFASDKVADYVWGQSDFYTNTPNKSADRTIVATPSSSSLWLSGYPVTSTGMSMPAAWGVSVDYTDTVWVADTYNGRVLAFAPNSKTATKVIGKANYSTRGCDMGPTNRLCTPMLAKRDPQSGQLYVLEAIDGRPFEARFRVYPAAITNGMASTSTFAPIQPGDWENWDGYGNNGHYFFQGTGFAFNPITTGDYANGKLWVNEHAGNRTLLVTSTGTMITALGAKSLTLRGGDSQYGGVCGSMYDGFRMGSPGGSIGFDSENNMYFADEWRFQVSRYAVPYTLQGNGCLPEPNGGAAQGRNLLGMKQLGESYGFVTFGNDLIAKDRDGWLRVWQNYLTAPSGSDASFVVNGPGTRRKDRLMMSQAIDGQNRLWTIGEHGTVDAFQLPLTAASTPVLADIKLHWADDQTAINHQDKVHNITYSPTEQALYFVDQGGSRILRVKDLTTLATGKLYVDLAIGVADKATGPCTVEPGILAPSTRELCRVWGVKVDKLGNLYAIDNNYECHGNKRILVYDIASLNAATSLFSPVSVRNIINAADMAHSGGCAYHEVELPGSPVSVAFDSQNHMVIGNDGYYGDWQSRSRRQVWYYLDPLTQTTPTKAIDIIMGAPGEITFDSQDNLLIQDHTWPKIYAINYITNPSWLVSPSQVPPRFYITSRTIATGVGTFATAPTTCPNSGGSLAIPDANLAVSFKKTGMSVFKPFFTNCGIANGYILHEFGPSAYAQAWDDRVSPGLNTVTLTPPVGYSCQQYSISQYNKQTFQFDPVTTGTFSGGSCAFNYNFAPPTTIKPGYMIVFTVQPTP